MAVLDSANIAPVSAPEARQCNRDVKDDYAQLVVQVKVFATDKMCFPKRAQRVWRFASR